MAFERYYVYILRSSKDGTFYVGCTNNMIERLNQHNKGLSQYTKSDCKKPWDLIWYAVFFNKKKAYLFEQYLKTSSGRAFTKKRIIAPNLE